GLAVARQLNKILRGAAAAITKNGDADGETVRARRAIQQAGFEGVDYVAARDALTLGEWQLGREGRLLAAGWLGKTRLIDNVEIPT
ncbi:MAG: pantoate--beta-alanine ligase, partial [Mesorhizobium sp.]|nr:pantoate--beta-alanine ligase [Mesorhizobium sp.]